MERSVSGSWVSIRCSRLMSPAWSYPNTFCLKYVKRDDGLADGRSPLRLCQPLGLGARGSKRAVFDGMASAQKGVASKSSSIRVAVFITESFAGHESIDAIL